MDDRMTLAALRVRAGYSQDEVADILGVSRPTLARWEHNSFAMPISALEHLTRLYQVPETGVYFGDATVLSRQIRLAYTKTNGVNKNVS